MKALESSTAAIRWALKHIPRAEEAYYTGRSANAASQRRSKRGEVDKYVRFYLKTKTLGRATLYRMLCVRSIKAIDWANLGIYWSFLRKGAGSYFEPTDANCKDVLITAQVSFDDITWEEGFRSFWFFGIREAEVQVKEGAELEIKAINHRPVIRWAIA